MRFLLTRLAATAALFVPAAAQAQGADPQATDAAGNTVEGLAQGIVKSTGR